jgi:Kdo2-lipid IVA lauroyltransferase/acyltransferase
LTRFLLTLVEWTRFLPFGLVRALGTMLGWLLYALVGSRRRVVQINLRLCFPQWTDAEVQRQTRRTFVYFAQAWLDRGWIWHGDPALARKRIKLVGAVEEFEGDAPTLVFAPHFIGMDAGWIALTQQLPRHFITIYAAQTNKEVNDWILQGRKRFGNAQPVDRRDGFKPVLAAVKAGSPLCLLPDMNYEPDDSVFVPFYDVQAATMPSLSRIARLGRAKVIAAIARITPDGYEIEISPKWVGFPSKDLVEDTALMNLRLQAYIDKDPAQYYWVHKRFKDRPAGEKPPY